MPKDNGRFPVLTSYGYLRYKKPEKIERLFTDERFDVLLDSGAYSAYMSGEGISPKEYIAFCKKWEKHLWGYVSLDVIKDPKATYRNWKAMLRRGLHPIPVHTVGDTEAKLNEYFKETDFVMLGGIFGNQQGNRQAIKLRMKWAQGRDVHWLGYANERLMRTFNPYSVDVTSWKAGARYGLAQIYLGSGRWTTLKRKECAAGKEVPREVLRVCESCGFSRRDLQNSDLWYLKDGRLGGWKRCISLLIGGRSWVQYSREYSQRFKTRIFLAGVGFLANFEDHRVLTHWVDRIDKGEASDVKTG